MVAPPIPDVNLFVSVISSRQWPARFGESLAGLMFHIGRTGLGGRLSGLRMTINRQAHPSTTRNEHLVQAQADGFTHLLSLDDDQTFPGDVADRLLAHAKPIVTCNYRKKQMELEYVCSGIDGAELNSTHAKGLERIKAMGMGMTFIDLACLKDIPQPYFAAVWNKDENQYWIEDKVFSYLLWNAGVEVWCDHDLSREIGHVGEYEYLLPAYTPSLSLVEQDAA